MTLPASPKNTPLSFPRSLSFLTTCRAKIDHAQGLGDLATEISKDSDFSHSLLENIFHINAEPPIQRPVVDFHPVYCPVSADECVTRLFETFFLRGQGEDRSGGGDADDTLRFLREYSSHKL